MTSSWSAAEHPDSNLRLSSATASANAGTFSGSATLSLVSHDPDLADAAVTVAPIVLTGTMNNYATAQVVEVTGTPPLVQNGFGDRLDFGNVALDSAAVTVELDVENAAPSVADLLGGSFVSSGDAAIADDGQPRSCPQWPMMDTHVTPALVACLSPYIRGHFRRSGP
jgi:hypothetical protein